MPDEIQRDRPEHGADQRPRRPRLLVAPRQGPQPHDAENEHQRRGEGEPDADGGDVFGEGDDGEEDEEEEVEQGEEGGSDNDEEDDSDDSDDESDERIAPPAVKGERISHTSS